MLGVDKNGSAGASKRQSDQARAAAVTAASIAPPAPPKGIGGARSGEEGGGGDDVDSPPTSIMHAAYVGALELVKSMVEVCRDEIYLTMWGGEGRWPGWY